MLLEDMKTSDDRIRVILFDLGGVLVELTGVPTLLSWCNNRMTPEELLVMWLRSPAVRSFEMGLSDIHVFARDLIEEMALPVETEEFVSRFPQWPSGLFPGALELVGAIPARYVRATLSNSNEAHWPRLMTEMKLADAFDHHFASHLIGKIKPDTEAFVHVIEELRCDASEVLFLDDNVLNVEAARQVGMNATVVKGVREAERFLLKAGVIESSRISPPAPAVPSR